MSDSNVKNSGFFTDLDSILDTRLGTIVRFYNDKFEDVIKNGYLNRDRDLFKGIDPEDFKQQYAKRDKLTLKASMMTSVLSLAKDFCKQIYEGNIKTPFIHRPKIIVNIYPYVLTEEEQKLIREVVMYRISKLCDVQLVNMSFDRITPGYLNSNISMAAIYEPFEWLEAQTKLNEWKYGGCPHVVMMGPLLFKDVRIKDITPEEFRSSSEMLCKPYIDLNLVVSDMFSAILKKIV